MTPLQLAWSLRRRLFALLGLRTRGVKLFVQNGAGDLLLVRNSYGKSRQWVLPGGGIGRRESAEAAAVRELREEVRCRAEALAPFGTYVATLEGRRDTVWLFRARTADLPCADGREIAEAAFFAPDRMPAETSPATRRRIAEVLGGVAIDPHW